MIENRRFLAKLHGAKVKDVPGFGTSKGATQPSTRSNQGKGDQRTLAEKLAGVVPQNAANSKIRIQGIRVSPEELAARQAEAARIKDKG